MAGSVRTNWPSQGLPERPALIEWPPTERVLRKNDHIEEPIDAHAPLACTVHVSGKKNGFWHE